MAHICLFPFHYQEGKSIAYKSSKICYSKDSLYRILTCVASWAFKPFHALTHIRPDTSTTIATFRLTNSCREMRINEYDNKILCKNNHIFILIKHESCLCVCLSVFRSHQKSLARSTYLGILRYKAL